MVLERQGKVLRVFDTKDAGQVLKEFVYTFRTKAIFPEKNRITVREYPDEMKDVLINAGFSREIMNYVLYR